MEDSDVHGGDTARLTQASDQTGVATRQDALPVVVKSSDQKIKEAATTHHSGSHKEVGQVEDTAKDVSEVAVDDEPAKTKKKKKSKSSKKKRMITGFEGPLHLPDPLMQFDLTRYQSFTAMRPSPPSKRPRRGRRTPCKFGLSFHVL